jgi:MFS family permease
MTTRSDDLDRWVDQDLITADQREAILAFELDRTEARVEQGPGRLANAVSTVGAAVAIAAVAGIVALFAQDWSSTQTMLAALVGATVMIGSGWLLVRNDWGAPGGLLVICGIALMPVAIGFAVDAAGWWPEFEPGKSQDTLDRERQRTVGIVLLFSLLPGLAVAWLRLRQVWAAAVLATWFGVNLLWTNPLETIGVVLAQVVAGVVVAGLAAFVWDPEADWEDEAWWLQLGGLILIGTGIMFSVSPESLIYPLLGVVAAALAFAVGLIRKRTSWMIAGAVPAIMPATRIIFDLFTGFLGLLIVAFAGLALAFVPLLIWRRRQAAS